MSNLDAARDKALGEAQRAQMEQRGFDNRVELANTPEAAILYLLNFLKVLGKDTEQSGWADWMQDIGKKMQDFAGSLMEKIGPSERDAIAIETDINLIGYAGYQIDEYKDTANTWSLDHAALVDWQEDFGIVGSIVHNEFARLREARTRERTSQEYKCQWIVRKGLGVLTDTMRILPKDKATHIKMDARVLEGLDIDPTFIHDTDNPDVKTIVLPSNTRSQMLSSDAMSLLIPMGTGAKGHKYVELTPDMWRDISFADIPASSPR